MGSRRKQITWEITETGCHNCTSHAPGTWGYPKLWKNGGSHNMMRVLYEEEFGQIPDNMVVRHKCDNPLCINLNHLELGTTYDNAQDRVNRGRSNPAVGERNSNLTETQMLEIKNSTEPQWLVGEKYGISQSEVSRIKSGKRWGLIQSILLTDNH